MLHAYVPVDPYGHTRVGRFLTKAREADLHQDYGIYT